MRTLIYGLLLFVFFFLSPQWSVYADRGFALGLGIAVILLWIDFFVHRRSFRIEWNMGHACLAAGLSWITLASVWNDAVYMPWRTALQYASLLSLVLCLSQSGHPFRYRHFLRCLSSVNLLIFGLVLLHLFAGVEIGLVEYARGSGRLSFTFGNPNYFAAVQVIFFALCAGDLIVAKPEDGRERKLERAAALSAIVLVFLSGSRNGILWVCLGSAFFALHYFTVQRRAIRWQRWHAYAALSGAVLLIWWAFSSGRNTLTKTADLLEGGGSSEMGRLTVWQVVLDLWTASPVTTLFGSGWGSLYHMSMNYPSDNLIYRLHVIGFQHAHSELLELLLEGGLVVISLSFLTIVWLFLSIRRIESHEERQKSEVLSVALLILAGFSCFSVATRYTVVLVPAAISLGLLIRNSSASRAGPAWSNLLICVLILGIGLGNLIVAGKHFASDAVLKKALNASPKEAKELYEQSVKIAPGRIAPRYEQFKFLCGQDESALKGDVAAAYHEINELIPNFKNVAEFYAYYLGSVGDFPDAAEQLRSLAEARTFQLTYLADALFYYWVSRDLKGFEETSRILLYRALLAETRGKGGRLAQVEWISSENPKVKLLFKDGRQSYIFLDDLGARIPHSVRANQPILRYYVFAEVSRMMHENIDALDSPRFLELMPTSDQDKVFRLAQKLDEISRKP